MTKERIFGLDIIRSGAITLVLVGHAIQCFSLPNTKLDQTAYYFGFFGVELFFVLSGFLIGQILLKDYQELKSYSFIKTFWIRRWLRTLPLYFLVLIIHDFLLDNSSEIRWSHYIFSQAYVDDQLSFFPVSWSLSVEEWFYLLIPLLFFFFPRKVISLKTAWFILIFSAGFICVTRFGYTIYKNPHYDSELRKNTFLRLDSIMVGVIFAYIKLYKKPLFSFLSQWYLALLSLATITIALYIGNILVFDNVGVKTIPASVGFLMNSLLLGFLVIYFDNSNLFRIKEKNILFKLVMFISTTSYCVYLIHYTIFKLLVKNNNFDFNTGISLITAFVLIFAISKLSLEFIEKPILKFRDKRFKA